MCESLILILYLNKYNSITGRLNMCSNDCLPWSSGIAGLALRLLDWCQENGPKELVNFPGNHVI